MPGRQPKGQNAKNRDAYREPVKDEPEKKPARTRKPKGKK